VAVWTVKCMSTDSSLYIFRQPFTECLSCLTLHTCVITTVDVTIHLLHRITWRRSDNEQIYIYIYIYINALCQEDGGEGSEYITKREKGERGRRAESRKWWNENEHLSVSLVRIYQNSVTKFQILSFERFPWIFLPPL